MVRSPYSLLRTSFCAAGWCFCRTSLMLLETAEFPQPSISHGVRDLATETLPRLARPAKP